MPKDIKPFKDRKIDIILYEKYADSNRTRQGNQLYNLLKDTDKTIERLVYSKYNIEYALKLAIVIILNLLYIFHFIIQERLL